MMSMNKTVTRYKLAYYTSRAGCMTYLAYADTGKDVIDEYVPEQLVSASDYDALKADFSVLVTALNTLSTGLMPHSAASIAYEALNAIDASKA